jgi:hypothetical protein
MARGIARIGTVRVASAARSQQALVDFLNRDLDLAFTFLNTARMDASDAPAHSRALIAKARDGLYTTRYLNGRIQDPAAWQEIHARADALEAAITEFSN